ncbi:MAG: hypothetical protein ACREAC_31050 [Blastocatellia bacterium]
MKTLMESEGAMFNRCPWSRTLQVTISLRAAAAAAIMFSILAPADCKVDSQF